MGDPIPTTEERMKALAQRQLVDMETGAVPAIGRFLTCAKCGRLEPVAPEQVPAEGKDFTCPTCFAVAVNGAGRNADNDKPLRVVWNEPIGAGAIALHGPAYPALIGKALENAAAELPDMIGGLTKAALFAKAREHGLLVMVVIQPATAPPAKPTIARRK